MVMKYELHMTAAKAPTRDVQMQKYRRRPREEMRGGMDPAWTLHGAALERRCAEGVWSTGKEQGHGRVQGRAASKRNRDVATRHTRVGVCLGIRHIHLYRGYERAGVHSRVHGWGTASTTPLHTSPSQGFL